MMARRRGRSLASGFAALALAVTVAGCGGASEGEATEVAGSGPSTTAPESSEPAEPKTSATPTKSPAPSTSTVPAEQHETSGTPDPEPKRMAGGIVGQLVAAEELPGFNEALRWKERSTRKREGRTPFGTCSRFAMTSIGATTVAVRTYAPATASAGATASNLVARFADVKTAKRAYEVLKAWRGQCQEQLTKHNRSEVGDLQPVPLDGDTVGDDAVGDWYLLVYGPAPEPDTAYFDAQGLTRVGSTISMLEMRAVGQDYNYRKGKEPMVGAVQRAAAGID